MRAQEAAGGAGSSESGTGENGPHVLVVDDNPQNLELLMAYLEGLPLRVSGASGGREALETLERDPAQLVLLDVMMPGMSGFQVCERIRGRAGAGGDRPTVVVVTALSEVGDVERARDAGADAFISKPVDRDLLIEEVRRHLPELA